MICTKINRPKFFSCTTEISKLVIQPDKKNLLLVCDVRDSQMVDVHDSHKFDAMLLDQ